MPHACECTETQGKRATAADAPLWLLISCSTHPPTHPSQPHPTYLPAGGIKEQQYVQLRSEAKAPFRLTRIILFGGLAAGAALGLFIIAGRLLAALQGGYAFKGST